MELKLHNYNFLYFFIYVVAILFLLRFILCYKVKKKIRVYFNKNIFSGTIDETETISSDIFSHTFFSPKKILTEMFSEWNCFRRNQTERFVNGMFIVILLATSCNVGRKIFYIKILYKKYIFNMNKKEIVNMYHRLNARLEWKIQEDFHVWSIMITVCSAV